MDELDDSGIDHSPVPGSGGGGGDDNSRNDYDETSRGEFDRDDGETMDGGGSSYDGGGKYDIEDDTSSPPGTERSRRGFSGSDFEGESGSGQGGMYGSLTPTQGSSDGPPGFEQNWGTPSHKLSSGPPGTGDTEDSQKHHEESVTSAQPQEVSNETVINGPPLSPQRQAHLLQQQVGVQQQASSQPDAAVAAAATVAQQQMVPGSAETLAAAVQQSSLPQTQALGAQAMAPQLAMNVAPGSGVPASVAPAAASAATIDLSGEVWVEAKSGDGKSYFYNARTRETTWTKPEGNVKVILQEQLEIMAQQAAAAQSGMMQAVQMAMPVQQAVDDKQAVTDPSQAHAVGMMSGHMMAPPFGGPPPGFPGGPPPFGMPPPGFPGAFPGGFAPPPWGMGPGGAAPPGMGPPPSLWSYSIPWQIDPEIIARAAEWTEHRSPDGRMYYYNAKAGESVWEKPQALKDLEAARVAASQGYQTTTSTVVSSISKQELMAKEAAAYVKKVKAAQAAAGEGGEDKSFSGEGKVNGDLGVDSSSGAAGKKEEKKSESDSSSGPIPASKPTQDKSKPVSSNPVPGTPWCVVWTGDGRVFFYNPSTRTSVWERPDDLVGRADVEKMVSSPPEVVTQAMTGSGGTSDSTGIKRDASSLNDDSTPSKKPKLDASSDSKDDKANDRPGILMTEKKAIDIGKEAAMEAEVRAARERASVPLDVRIKSFREMLAEKEVSAFSTWEKELHKIVFDGRYLLLTSKERKQVFDKYVKERAEEERREKRNKMKERKEEFRRLMMDANLHGKSSFSDFAAKHCKDERFRNIEKMRERESLFNEYILDVRKREKEEKVQKRDQIKRDFFSLLKESPDIDRHSRWSEVKKKLDSDPRYRAVDSSMQREDWFREFMKRLKEERKREKEMSRSKEERRERKERKERSSKTDEKRSKSKEPKENKERRSSVGGDHEENEAEVDGQEEEEEELAKEREALEKQARVEASLREREKEVQRTLAVHLRDRDTEREHHKHEEAVQHFNALLADLVRNCELGWREAKRQLRKDHRWELASLLERDEKEKLFNAHIEQLTLKKKEKFRELLNETPECTLSCSWKEVRKLIKEDPRYSKFSSSDRKCEREFKEYIKDKLVAAKADLRELLQETKLITHKSNGMVQENENHMREIEEMLEKDKRWLVLAHLGEERRDLLRSYLVELEKRGPPPPPTACDPSRRPTAK